MPPRAAAASLDHLPPDVVELIAGSVLAEVSPFFDRHDVLQLACNLTAAGSPGTRLLASHLFTHLSPRLGAGLPNGVTQASKAAELKAALKLWGLPVSGAKPELWQRLLDQVQDSEVDEEGEPPRHCRVSGATREELTGHLHTRISQGRCKAVFNLTKCDLSQAGLPYELQQGSGSALPSKMFLLSDVKRQSLAVHGSYALIQKMQRDAKARSAEWDAAVEARTSVLQQELLGRGHSVAASKELLAMQDSGWFLWGDKEVEPPASACDSIELLAFVCTAAYTHWLAALQDRTWQPPRSLSGYRREFAVREHAAQAALPGWVAAQPSLQAIRQHPRVPASLLPRLEALWEARQAQQP